ncbi:tRNA (adenosine(37)-N6)-threonylcarbamoyltransferase complex ATPase subunit type 1 TsaE [Pasteurellaceae bacterium 22721_9_1]
MNPTYTTYLANEEMTCQFGKTLAHIIAPLSAQNGFVVYLNGDLGAGKTTLSRGMIQGLGHKGNVKSPTYTLVEEYQLQQLRIYHFDLYRLNDPEELEFMGIRDYFSANSICLIEWAEKGANLLTSADLIVNISYANEARHIELVANSSLGQQVIQQIA